ncbi:hypothetical protein LSCM4_03052 [Leishmania orientalis]|uniref:Uncharacterized protein n=1 Tax=Leishmania orientalis TaxID=2249476 RepID=A0A836G8Y0_9TRYP|nr:hypothetical protein LSCM4_03052 [Leishmania orientalis]
MSKPSLCRSERSARSTQDRVHYVRAQRQHLVRETQMLRMALEELQEEAEQANGEEALARRAIDERHRELLRCLLHLSVAELDTTGSKAQAAGAQVQPEATSAIVCEVLRQYKAEQDTFTQEVNQHLEQLRKEAQQSCVSVGDTSVVHLPEQDHRSSVDSIAEEAELNSLRSELEALCEMKATVDEETEAAMLSVGRGLFC